MMLHTHAAFRVASRTALVAVSIPSLVFAVSREEAPESARLQVQNALRTLAVAVVPRESSSTSGTLQGAIERYYPKKAWPVDEGTIPPVRARASCPEGMALVFNRTCVDVYEGAIVASSTGVLHSPYAALEEGVSYRAVSRAGVVPQGYISATQAAAACRNAGKRMCGAAEWRLACAGSKATAFPYGPTRVSGTCNDGGKSGILVYHADKLRTGLDRAALNDPRINQLEGTVAKTGDFQGCVNDFGLHDMVGNLHEWTADSNGTFQGGYYLDTREHGDGCAYRTIVHNAEYHDYSTGFRCCADPIAALTESP